MRGAFGLILLAGSMALAHAADAPLTQQQAEARKQQTELRNRIEALQKEIDSQESARRDAAIELKSSESAISTINRRIDELAARAREAEKELDRLQADIRAQKKTLAQKQHQLGDQLRAQYASGLSPWTALLSGNDPQVIGRDLSYLGYITEAQADAVRAVRGVLDELAVLQAQVVENRKELAQVAQETGEQKKSLEEQKAEREKVLARIEQALKTQRSQAERLARNDQRLGELISGLEVAIAKQAEEARLAEEKRRAEEARKVEAARIAAQERERALERQREEARRAEQAARAAAAKAQRERDQQEAEKARLQVESALARARAAERAVEEERKRNEEAEQAAKVVRGSVPGMGTAGTDSPAAGTALARAAPPGGFTGLHRGLPYPVSGEVLGRFGAERPEGGLWRGIVLRSPEGTGVQAVAAGRVVYANWLSGFGNIMIVDHGAKYLSVYAYNQSLLKRVGDIVAAGDTIATVGATGGQVDSGLYFEIRHQGTPVNPLLWLRR